MHPRRTPILLVGAAVASMASAAFILPQQAKPKEVFAAEQPRLTPELRDQLDGVWVGEFGKENLRWNVVTARLNQLVEESGVSGTRFRLGEGLTYMFEVAKFRPVEPKEWNMIYEPPEPGRDRWQVAYSGQEDEVAFPIERTMNCTLSSLVDALAELMGATLVERNGEWVFVRADSVEGELAEEEIPIRWAGIAGGIRQYPGGIEAIMRKYGYLVHKGAMARVNFSGRSLTVRDVPAGLQAARGRANPVCGMGMPPYCPSAWDKVIDVAYYTPAEVEMLARYLAEKMGISP